MNPRLFTGLCILLMLSGISSAQVEKQSYISKIEYGASPSKYIGKGEEVTVQVMVMGKKMDATEWGLVTGTVKVEAEPVNSAIPSTVSSGGTISFTPESDTWLTLTFDGDDTYQGSEKKILIGVLYFSSPIVSSQFILMFIILIIALLSYRLFSRGKLDINSLWGNIRGE